MFKLFTVALLVTAAPFAAWAQLTPVGSWHSIDDKTNEIKSEIVIADNGGVLTGRITKLLRKEAKQDAVCDQCTDDRKGKPVLGMSQSVDNGTSYIFSSKGCYMIPWPSSATNQVR